MEYVIQLLEREKKVLETSIRDQDMLRKDMRKATLHLKNINELKRALKVLKTKVRLLS
ncbi:hypothetical protein M8998_01690 [Sphingobacterium sp. lm-10]|uniref:hypothetical protein n=1 Tax=Sphingobacterium sp. lm-10 TaxID=2944904 RepID=UPI00202224BF|nr:hypothetical protein [Sphingobacterium sp. lm-10]MCL7986643.1 hypothetical protein [Sphingobacterium sp. lm-10]